MFYFIFILGLFESFHVRRLRWPTFCTKKTIHSDLCPVKLHSPFLHNSSSPHLMSHSLDIIQPDLLKSSPFSFHVRYFLSGVTPYLVIVMGPSAQPWWPTNNPTSENNLHPNLSSAQLSKGAPSLPLNTFDTTLLFLSPSPPLLAYQLRSDV